MATTLQPLEEIEAFYAEADPWSYDATIDDRDRKARLRALLPPVKPSSTLDIGCGNARKTTVTRARKAATFLVGIGQPGR